MRESITNYIAGELMKAWFPRSHSDQEWLESEDGRSWTEIALLDAQVALKAYNTYYEEKYAY